MKPGYESVVHFRNQFQAQMVASLLDNNGIKAHVDTIKGMFGSGARLAANYFVCVRVEDLKRAREFLAEVERNNRTTAEEEEAEEPTQRPPRRKVTWWEWLFGTPARPTRDRTKPR